MSQQYIVLAPAFNLKHSLKYLPSDHKSGEQTEKLCQLWLFWLRRKGTTEFLCCKMTYLQDLNSVLLPSPFRMCSFLFLTSCQVSNMLIINYHDVAGTGNHWAAFPHAKYLTD